MEDVIRHKASKSEKGLNARHGLAFKRHFTKDGLSPLEQIAWTKRRPVITEPNGSIVFELGSGEVPEDGSPPATDIVVSKSFRKAGVPGTGHEVSVKQVIRRIAHTLRVYGEEHGSFQTRPDADSFEDERTCLLVTRRGACNSPVSSSTACGRSTASRAARSCQSGLGGNEMLPFEFVVIGTPVSQQIRRQDRKRAWMDAVAAAARASWPDRNARIAQSIYVTILYFHRGETPDSDNPAKPILDALKGVVYEDDRIVTDHTVRTRELAVAFRMERVTAALARALESDQPFVYIRIEAAPDMP